MIDRHECVSAWCRLITNARVSKPLTARGSNILEWSASRPPSAYAGTVTLPGIAFNLLAQTSQLAARINLGSPPMWRDLDEESKKKNDSQWTEKRAKRNEGSAGDKGGNNRPITWVTEDDRSRESRRQKSYLMGIANTMGAAKPIRKARNSAYDGRRAHSSSSSSFSSSLSFLLLPRRRHDRTDRMPQPVVVPVSLHPHRFASTRPLVHLPCSGGREIIRSFPLPFVSINVPSDTTFALATFSITFLSSACLALPFFILIFPFPVCRGGLIDGSSCRDELGPVAAVFFGRLCPSPASSTAHAQLTGCHSRYRQRPHHFWWDSLMRRVNSLKI